MPCHTISSRDFLATGICQIDRTLCLTTNSTPNARLISCQGLPNTWALVNCSTNTCQSDTSWFITPKQQGQKFQSLELPYLHFTGGLGDAWKTFPWSGVKSKIVPSTFLCFWSHHQNMKIFLSHFINVRSVSRLDPLNLHSLDSHQDRHSSPVNAILNQYKENKLHL